MGARPRSVALTTDLYELTMAAAYYRRGYIPTATFELFVREMPPNRGYLLAAGLEQALDYLEALAFSDTDIGYLQGLPVFAHVPAEFWSYLAQVRFTGEVLALPEGTPFFAEEPILSVTAPLIEAQIVESYLLAVVNFQSLIATKAARVVDAAEGRGVADFGLRRAHGTDAAFWAARASFIGGCVGTSNVDAAQVLGIPPVGTAAHSYTLAFGDEMEAFAHYAETFPDHATLLIDTYDTLEGARRATRIGKRLKGVRLDSGDLAELSRQVRAILDEAGCTHTKIVASGNLNEYRIADLVRGGAPIDLFGVGTEMITSYDAPALPGVYKLVAVEGEPRAKRSEGKAMLPGRKSVVRFADSSGRYVRDRIVRAEEAAPTGAKALLEPVMRGGRRIAPSPSLDAIRDRARDERGRLPDAVRRIRDSEQYPVEVSDALRELSRRLAAGGGR